MPHQRARYAAELLKKALHFSPIVGVVGQRQTGKTTLSSQFCEEYQTLDGSGELTLAEADPFSYLQGRRHPFAVDECQLCPPLFPALKEQVRIHPKMGQFILTGSVRFTSRAAIRESLTGRIVTIELLPLSLSESSNGPLNRILSHLLKKGRLPETQSFDSWATLADFARFLETLSFRQSPFFQEVTQNSI